MGPLETFGPGGLIPLAVITLIAATIAVCSCSGTSVMWCSASVGCGTAPARRARPGSRRFQPAAVLPGTSPTVVLPRSRPESALLE